MVHYKTFHLIFVKFLWKKTPNRPNYFFDFPIIGSKIKIVVDPSVTYENLAVQDQWKNN